MPRISGIDIPAEKRIIISLTYLHGVGRSRSGEILKKAGIDEMVKAKDLTDEEVEQLAGSHYEHVPDRKAVRWGKEEGHVIFAGRKVAIEKPRIRSKDGRYAVEPPKNRHCS